MTAENLEISLSHHLHLQGSDVLSLNLPRVLGGCWLPELNQGVAPSPVVPPRGQSSALPWLTYGSCKSGQRGILSQGLCSFGDGSFFLHGLCNHTWSPSWYSTWLVPTSYPSFMTSRHRGLDGVTLLVFIHGFVQS